MSAHQQQKLRNTLVKSTAATTASQVLSTQPQQLLKCCGHNHSSFSSVVNTTTAASQVLWTQPQQPLRCCGHNHSSFFSVVDTTVAASHVLY
ncbi:hypothetical protein LSAT2_015521, partial [Lamellibrachia satsuma]